MRTYIVLFLCSLFVASCSHYFDEDPIVVHCNDDASPAVETIEVDVADLVDVDPIVIGLLRLYDGMSSCGFKFGHWYYADVRQFAVDWTANGFGGFEETGLPECLRPAFENLPPAPSPQGLLSITIKDGDEKLDWHFHLQGPHTLAVHRSIIKSLDSNGSTGLSADELRVAARFEH